MSELNIIKKNEGVLHLGVERPFFNKNHTTDRNDLTDSR